MGRGTGKCVMADAGFSLVETLTALVLVLVISGALFGLLNPNVVIAGAQPEMVDMQQRARVAGDLLSRDLRMAGAGLEHGPRTGSLSAFFAPIVPRVMGRQHADPFTAARADAVTIAYVPRTFSQSILAAPLPPSLPLTVQSLPSCPAGSVVCGLNVDDFVVVFDDGGRFDFFRVTDVQGASAVVSSLQQGAPHVYAAGAVVARTETHTYYLDAVRRQLRHYDGDATDVPVVDNVVDLAFEYFGDPRPPVRPKPPLGQANCLYDAAGNPVGGMSVLVAPGGSPARLPLAMLNDGPWCGAGHNQYDADLLRITKVRVTVRVQASPSAMRASGADYLVSGTGTRALGTLPDYTLQFDVAPRNTNLGR